MNKLIKGAVTGAAGIALLLGGVGTFAAWNDSTSIGSSATAINTGSLQFDGAPAPTGTNGWYTNSALTTPLAAGFLAVPGDTLYYQATVKIKASGTNLAANFGVGGTTGPTVSFATSATGTSEQASASIVSVTGTGIASGSTAGVYTITPTATASTDITATVVVSVTFPFGTSGVTTGQVNQGTDGQNNKITLADVPLTLTQVTKAS
ncbi:alternate-type signal peptide domain-containing protein [Gryllotalpicola reticulitermitis]|uniref:Alternate-type signal peptide domain-containing protein n=1 Tax=Gryllotalpicola reticulitermitis TaxID=1184153 RepID=A0ABV8Q4H4_9MICO